MRHYEFVVGLPLLLSGLSIGVIGILNELAYPVSSHRLLVALVIFIWLTYSFSRLPAPVAALISVLASVPLYGSALYISLNDQISVLMYVAVANLVGWTSAVQIERRERQLFLHAKNLRDLSATVEERLQEIISSTQERERLLGRIVHDLRQPLSSLDLYFAQLRRFGDSASERFESRQLERIDTCLAFIRAGIAQLFSSEKKNENEVEPISIRALLEAVMRIHEGQLVRDGVQFRTFWGRSSSAKVTTNELKLSAILSNVIENAGKFSSVTTLPKREVLISVIRFHTEIRIDVVDNGIGIDPEDVAHVFDLNWRGRLARALSVQGSGIGLASAKELCMQLPGHSIEISSIPNSGTRVRLRLPVD